MSIGKNIAKYRAIKKMSQVKLGELLGVSNQAVSKWESEKTAPDISLLPGIAAALDISLNTLYGISESDLAALNMPYQCGSEYNKITREEIVDALDKMKKIKVLLIGDVCLDVYWYCDMTKSILSRETPQFPLPVTGERMSLGAGGNVANNMSVFTENVYVISVIGNDWRGEALKKELMKRNIQQQYIVQSNQYITNAYCKPMRRGYLGFDVEDSRIDFENFTNLDEKTEDEIIRNLEIVAKKVDVICISDQFEKGVITDRVREKLNSLPVLKVVDSRSKIDKYRNAIIKPNEIECAVALGMEKDALKNCSEEQIQDAMRQLSKKTDSAVCLTLGERGMRFIDGNNSVAVGGIKVAPPIDTCGAGDCFLSCFGLAVASGLPILKSAMLANMASAVIIKKINTTGCAEREEILRVFDSLQIDNQ